jgi:DNA-binding GntR family transcriptional regulator
MGTKKERIRNPDANLYFEILRRIARGEFHPGQRLVEEELASEFQVSRTPIREVLFKLEHDGLVQRLRNHGARVTSFTPDDIEEIYEIRKCLECLGIRYATKSLKLIDLLDLEHRLEELHTARGTDLIHRQSELDVEMHKLIVSHSGNRRLVAFLDNLSMLIHSVRLLSHGVDQYARATTDEHLAVIRALLRRDADLAERLLGEHIEASKQRALGFFLKKDVGSKPLRRTSVKAHTQSKHGSNVQPTENDEILSAQIKMEG